MHERVVEPIRASGVPANRLGSSFNHVTPVCAAGDWARGRAMEGAEALRRRTALHWGGWLIEVASRLRLHGIVPSAMLNQSGDQRMPAVVRVLAEPIVQINLLTPLPQVFGAVLRGILEFRIRKGAPSAPITDNFGPSTIVATLIQPGDQRVPAPVRVQVMCITQLPQGLDVVILGI